MVRFDDISGAAHVKRALEVAAAGHHTVSLFGEGPVARLGQLADAIGVVVVVSDADITVEVPVVPKWMIGDPRYRGEPHDRVMQRVLECVQQDLSLDSTTSSLLHAGTKYYSLSRARIAQVVGVALTVANLARAKSIDCAHVAEALQYVRS